MLRTALRPRWLALLAAVGAVVYAFTLLGLWQLDVARDSGAQEALAARASRPAVAVDEILAPHAMVSSEAAGRIVHATGRYDVSKQELITPRRLGEATGMWVMTPLLVEATGAYLPIVRGFVTDAGAVPAPPTGPVTVTGMLAPGEGPPDAPVALPAGQMAKIDLARLVNEWDGPLYSAFVFAADESPTGAAVTRVPPPDGTPSGYNPRNLAYALQWWIFAAFALYMWVRMVREDHQRSEAAGVRAPGPPQQSPASQVTTTRGLA